MSGMGVEWVGGCDGDVLEGGEELSRGNLLRGTIPEWERGMLECVRGLSRGYFHGGDGIMMYEGKCGSMEDQGRQRKRWEDNIRE